MLTLIKAVPPPSYKKKPEKPEEVIDFSFFVFIINKKGC